MGRRSSVGYCPAACGGGFPRQGDMETAKEMIVNSETTGALIGVVGGTLVGGRLGLRIGIASRGWGIAGTVPLAIIGAIALGLVGYVIAREIDRNEELS